MVAVRLLGHLVHRIGGRVNVHRGGWAGVSPEPSKFRAVQGSSGHFWALLGVLLTVERSCGIPTSADDTQIQVPSQQGCFDYW